MGRFDLGCCCTPPPCTLEYMLSHTACCPGVTLPATLHATWNVTCPNCFVREFYLPPTIELVATIISTDPCKLAWVSPIYELICQYGSFAFPPEMTYYLWQYAEVSTLQFFFECIPNGNNSGGTFVMSLRTPWNNNAGAGSSFSLTFNAAVGSIISCNPFSLIVDPGTNSPLIPRFYLDFINAYLPAYNPIKFQFPIPPALLLPSDEIPGIGTLCGQCGLDLPGVSYPPITGDIIRRYGAIPAPPPGTIVGQDSAVVLTITSIG